MKTFLSTTALLALLAAPLAAQDQTQPEMQPETQMAPETGQETTAPEGSESAAAPADMPLFIANQQQGDILASELIGVAVVDPAGDTLGDVNDIVYGPEQSISALVIGVGGFLGMGEKHVAVAFDRLTLEEDEVGAIRLVLDTTAEELAAAPDFVSLAEARAAAEAELRQQQLEQQQQAPAAQ
jgi:sporulation protein YlmC with PRC-barrel domain